MPKRLAATTGMFLAAVLVSLGFAEMASARWAYHIVNHNSGMALMPAGGSTAWGTPLLQRPVNGRTSQHWFLNSEGDGWWRFTNRASNRCIHPSEWSPIPGAYLLQASCTTSNGARKWYLTPAGARDGYTFTIRSKKSGLHMDIEDSSRVTNALTVQASRDGTASQIWHLEPVGDV
jgi:endoglucanase